MVFDPFLQNHNPPSNCIKSPMKARQLPLFVLSLLPLLPQKGSPCAPNIEVFTSGSPFSLLFHVHLQIPSSVQQLPVGQLPDILSMQQHCPYGILPCHAC